MYLLGDKKIHGFPKGIRPKVNVIANGFLLKFVIGSSDIQNGRLVRD